MFVGQSKAGTTSVSRALADHPAVDVQQNPLLKVVNLGDKTLADEAHIFDFHRHSVAKMTAEHWVSTPAVTEARAGSSLLLQYTPNYMYYPDAPLNILAVYPNARSIKYIFMVREPVHRAVTAWKFHHSFSGDWRTFEQVVSDGIAQRQALEACYAEKLAVGRTTAKTVEDLPAQEMRAVLDDCFWGRKDTHDRTIPPETLVTLMHAHVDKGIYVDQLRRWFSQVGRQNCFVFSLEEWIAGQRAVFSNLTDFLGLQMVGPLGHPDEEALNRTLFRRLNSRSQSSADLVPDPASVGRLRAFYEPYNQAFVELLGRRLW